MEPVTIKFCGQIVSTEDMELIQELAEDFWGIARSELANTICELLGWRRPNGKLKGIECVQFLENLEERGVLKLPRKRSAGRGKDKPIARTDQATDQKQVTGSVSRIGGVVIERVVTREQQQQFKELVDRYHYLGYKTPFGARLRYQVRCGREKRLLGCLQYSSPAWKVKARDTWIGWSVTEREAGLQRIVQNSRFLILPWVRVKNLASHILGKVSRRLAKDWERDYGYQPVLMETFVEKRFHGTSYQAANWVKLGETRGRGREDRHHRDEKQVKTVWVYPLHKQAREQLRQGRG